MSNAAHEAVHAARPNVSSRALKAMEELNTEASSLHIWLRTQANAPAQKPWFHGAEIDYKGGLAQGRVAAGQAKTLPQIWRWKEISPYLTKIANIAKEADISPIEFADRQQFLLVNPGFNGRLQVTSTIRCAISIYNPNDVAPVHLHSPNASRTILSESGGYTTIEGERCEAGRGDLILTPNGTWHDHGNDGTTPVIWQDILDWPILENLDCIWLDEDFKGQRVNSNSRAQSATVSADYSARLYGQGGLVPSFVSHQRGIGQETSPMLRYRGQDISAGLQGLRAETGDPYEGIILRFVNPATGKSLFPTLDYRAQLLRPAEATEYKRETSSALVTVMKGTGYTEIAGTRYDWSENDIFVMPGFLWRKHVNTGTGDAILYSVSGLALIKAIGQYRSQGRARDGKIVNLDANA